MWIVGFLLVSAAILKAVQPLRVLLLSAGCVTALGSYTSPRAEGSEDSLPMAGSLVLLAPKQRVGRKLPIADSIDLDLSTGRWVVVLHRHDCPACQEVVPQYAQLAMQEQVALVEVPPYGDSHASANSALHLARLSDDRDWFIQTPVETQLADGLVIAVKDHGN